MTSETHETTDLPVAKPFAPCAAMLTGGVVTLLVAFLAISISTAAELPFLGILAALAVLAGIVMLCMGLHALLTHVDNFARAQRGLPLP